MAVAKLGNGRTHIRLGAPATVDEALHRTVVDMLAGARIVTDKDTSYEVLHYRTGMTNPRARITAHPRRPFNIVGAVARFVWMVAGSNRLEDIAFYEEKVRSYTDNDLTVPGSSYGKRLFDAAPGLDQIHGVIDRLKADPDTRQAAAVVWIPEDAVRPSRDIPCTFGMFFHIRDGKLVMCTVMRSNNAYRLLPFNFFEFSLLGEVVAATLDVPMGEYIHFAASMHVYDNNFEMPDTLALAKSGPADSIEMPAMPGTDQQRLAAAQLIDDADPKRRDERIARACELATAVGQATELARLEAQLRHAYTASDFDKIREHAARQLNDYWIGLFNVLVTWGAAKRGWRDTATAVVDALPDYLVEPTRTAIAKRFPELFGAPVAPSGDNADTLFELAADLPKINPASAAAAESRQEAAYAAAVAALADFDTRTHLLTVGQIPKLADLLTRDSVGLAARSEVRAKGAPADRYLFTDDMIHAALEQLQ